VNTKEMYEPLIHKVTLRRSGKKATARLEVMSLIFSTGTYVHFMKKKYHMTCDFFVILFVSIYKCQRMISRGG
jgi:hypothetical protein